MVSPPLVTLYTTSTARSAESIVNHYMLSSIKLSPKKLKDFVLHLKPTKTILETHRSTAQINAFLVDGNLLTDRNKILEMWANHFESLGTPSDSSNFNNDFCHRVTTRVPDVLQICVENPLGALCEPLEYEEVAHVLIEIKTGCCQYLH